MKTEANIGEPFTVSAPAEVVFKESGLILYIDFGFLPPRTTAVIRYRDRKIYLSHNLHCDQKDCEGFTYDENTFREEAKLGELYTLKFNKVIASIIVKEYNQEGTGFVLTARSLF